MKRAFVIIAAFAAAALITVAAQAGGEGTPKRQPETSRPADSAGAMPKADSGALPAYRETVQ